jgi:pantothenate kinase
MGSKEEALTRAEQILSSAESRVVVGIFGKPGVGKSTFTEFLAKNLPRDSVKVVSMDGFHLSNQVLESLGLSQTKGAPNTFDVSGFGNLLSRIRNTPFETIYYPIFDRAIEESIAAQDSISPNAKLVFVEGNYLCHDRDGWEEISSHFDETWYLELPDDVRVERLVERHINFGKSPEFAREWALGTDEKNAILIAKNSHRADFVVRVD